MMQKAIPEPVLQQALQHTERNELPSGPSEPRRQKADAWAVMELLDNINVKQHTDITRRGRGENAIHWNVWLSSTYLSLPSILAPLLLATAAATEP